MMMKHLFTIIGVFFALVVSGQDNRLAQQYYAEGEYEKASVLYEKLYKQSNFNDYYFDRYVDCLMAMENFDDCEKTIKKQLKRDPDNIQLHVTYGKMFERQIKDEEAKEQFKLAIEKLPKDQFSITKLANSFTRLTKYELAIETYERGADLLKDDKIFAINLGDLYRRKGDNKKMIENYLNGIAYNPDKINSVKSHFQRYLIDSDYDELQAQLYNRIQEDPNSDYYPEMLAWAFIQKKDYPNALRQVRALDRRFGENGGRVFRLGQTAANDKDYDTAIKAYQYIIDNKGAVSSYYLDAKRESLRCKRYKLVEGYSYTMPELKVLENEYEIFLDEFGRTKLTANIILELAELEALYINDLDKSIQLLQEMITYPNVNEVTQAYGKLSLADYYLMQGEIWEATLLYSQVDKSFKEGPLGHEARFRNAKLSYYAGDFQWAQAQFDILKASTSKLISNDALDLSIFIMDNLGLDTTAEALQLYADADLLVFQNKFGEAFSKLDTLNSAFPDHGLKDDQLYLKAQIYKKQRAYDKAEAAYLQIIEKHPEEIRTDNSMYELAQLYEGPLEDEEKAKELYFTLFKDYSGSTFAVDARSRYRILRGDNIQ